MLVYAALAIGLLAIMYKVNQYIRNLRLQSLGGRAVVITGCDSGFGKELAIQLDAMSINVFAGCLTQDGIDDLKLYLRTGHCLPLDITDLGSVQEFYRTVEKELGPQGLWALVNNAGISGLEAPVELCGTDDFMAAMKVNVFGGLEMIRAFLPRLRMCKGRIVNTTSVAGRFAVLTGPYCVSKFAFEALSDCLRREVSRQGVKVSIIEPGLHRTAILDPRGATSRLKAVFDKCTNEVRTAYGEQLPQIQQIQYNNLLAMASSSRQPVIDAYIQAITSRFPKTRYVVGPDARFVCVPASLLPDWFTDFCVGIFKNGTGLVKVARKEV